MPVRVSPTEQLPTHHISLRDRKGRTLGLILCDEKGQPIKNASGAFNKIPVETTAQKQTSGSSSYNDYQYPYSPIVQDDLSGGRANLDFERDSTRFYDSFRTLSGRANKAYAGPQEQFTSGLISQNQNTPGNVVWHKLFGSQRHLYYRFQASASYTAGLLWVLARRKSVPGDLTLAIYSDSAGNVGSVLASTTVSYDRLPDVLSEWLNETISQALTSGTYYWLVIYGDANDSNDKYWLIATKNTSGNTYASENFDTKPTAISKDLYFRVTTSINNEKSCIPFQYKEQQYFVISSSSGAPNLYIAGDRGTADSNAGQLDRLNDATKSWTVNQWAGAIVKIIDGTGVTEKQPWRVVESNGTNYLVVTEDYIVTHDTTTEYVILDDTLTEITGHGLTAPVTDVLVTTAGIILFAQGDSVNIRRAKFETSAGVWTPSYADDGTNKATFLAYKPQAQKIVKANQRDASNDTSIAFADPVAWATASHTFSATPTKVDSKYVRITGLAVYPDSNGDEALWVFKEDIPFIVPGTGNPYPLNIEEMRTVRSPYNGRNPLTHNVYLYFPLGSGGLERYYGTTIDDIGPNKDEGLPSGRRGSVSCMAGYPGAVFAAIDAGVSGYSSILQSGGWHERYRAPLGQRITAMQFQTIPGDTVDRLWVYQGNDLIWLPFPSDTTNELEDVNYSHTPEFAITLSRMHAGLFDVQKLVRKLKLQTENLEVSDTDGDPVCWFELDYRINEDTEWVSLEKIFNQSPTQEIDFVGQYGLSGKRLQFRIRGYTSDATKTPVFLAIVINAVLRTDVKYMYQIGNFRVMDNEPLLNTQELDPIEFARDKMQILEDWADASSDSMLKMESISPLFHNKMVFINPPQWRQILFKTEDTNNFQREVFIGSATFQEA